MEYDQGYQEYMQEVYRYLGQVKQGRRVAGHDPIARRFSAPVEDQRQAKAMGIPYQAPPQATAPYSRQLSPQYGFNPGQGETPVQGQQEDSWLQRLQMYLGRGNR